MHVQSLIDAMEAIAPLHLAAEWDNVGLLVGSPAAPLAGPVVIATDLTAPVLDEAVDRSASAVIAYHPPIWTPLTRITDTAPGEKLIFRAIESGIAVYSPHTALDNTQGGMNDWLAQAAGGTGDTRALRPHAALTHTQECKIVTFVPYAEADRLRKAMASSGAGIIGAYRVCSFQTPGTGTFLGDETTAPAVGATERLEHVDELRLEMVCSRAAVALVLETLREFHPYEEPAVDVYALEPQPRRGLGAGRRVLLDQPAPLEAIAQRVKEHLGVDRVKLARASGMNGPVGCIGVCPGAGSSLVDCALDDGCQLFLTGEMRYHEVVRALSRGMSIMLAGHTTTERGYMPLLRDTLAAMLSGIDILVARADQPLIELL